MAEEHKLEILATIESIDVKKFDLEHDNPMAVKWFRFGAHTSIEIVKEIIKNL